MNRYEDSTQRLQSHGWSEEYKENYDAVFGVRYRLYYSDGSQILKKFKDDKEASWFIHNEGDHLINHIKL